MKKLLILSVLLLCVISVYAQYNTVAINPKMVSTTIQPSGSCYDVCKRDCIAGQRPADECAKMCDVKCNPKPQSTPVQEDCATMCRRLSSPVSLTAEHAGFNFDIFLRCMHDRCKQDCESSCRTIYGSQMMDCIQKYCRPQSETCEQGCDEKQKRCMDTVVGLNVDSIRKACEIQHSDCLQDECGKPEGCEGRCAMISDECAKGNVDPQVCQKKLRDCYRECPPQVPQTCEDRCGLIKGECDKTGVDPQLCQKKIRDCLRGCKPQCPECPPRDCQGNCVDGYYKCSDTARTMKAPAGDPAVVLENYMMKCRKGVAECLDECKPQEVSDQPNCPRLCERRHKECLDSNVDPAKCADDLKYCERVCGQGIPNVNVNTVGGRPPSPEELVGLNPQPEPPMPVGVWARMKSWFKG